jgi:hypothetical protein
MDAATTDDRPRATPDQIDEAREMYSDDDIEIDDDALVSEGDGGAWVQAWVWVPDGGADEHYQDTATTDDLERSYGPHQAALMRGAV